MWWLVGVVVGVVWVATYLTWIAARVDRLHHRAGAAYSALDAQLVRRAAAAFALADTEFARASQAPEVRSAARAAQRAAADKREVAENKLTRILRELSLPERVASHGEADPAPLVQRQWRLPPPGVSQLPSRLPQDPAVIAAAEVIAASRRVALARQVHSDLVRDTLAVRRHP
ncbi:MAG: hypothetical protein ACRDT8_26795, partial [Micromonosporaceae bacterium]